MEEDKGKIFTLRILTGATKSSLSLSLHSDHYVYFCAPCAELASAVKMPCEKTVINEFFKSVAENIPRWDTKRFVKKFMD